MMLFAAAILFSLSSTAYSSRLQTRDVACDNSNGTIYTDPDGFSYYIDCGHTGAPVPAGELFTLDPVDLPTCIQQCSTYNLGGPVINCSAVVLTTNNCLLKASPVLNETTDSTFVGAASLVAVPEPFPAPPISFNLSCPTDVYTQYIGPLGYTYNALCGIDTAFGSDLPNDGDATKTPDLPACMRLCSQYNELGNTPPCDAGVRINELFGDPNIVGNCYLKSGTPKLAISPTRDAAFIVAPPKPCDLTAVYDTPEGDEYNLGYIGTSNYTSYLSESNQETGCGCAEQCSRFNRYYNTTACQGVEFDPFPPQDGFTCHVKTY